MRQAATVLLFAAACSGGTTSTGDMAGGGPPDLLPRSTAGIACGAVACTTGAQLCCTNDSGKTGTCQSSVNPSCGNAEFLCDGREDCEPANPECCVQGGYAACRIAGYCASQTNAQLMCHLENDCPPGQHCCPAPNGSPYSLCLTQLCPI
jgi:hypothetical protein